MNWERAVENVLEGRSALGEAFDRASVNFTKDEEAAKALAAACEQLHDAIQESLSIEDDEGLTAFIAKMAVYCAKQGWNNAELVSAGIEPVQEAIAEAINDNPSAITSKAGISGILKKHGNKKTAIEASSRRERLTSENSEPVEICVAGGHKLVELFTPQHLKDESNALFHCIGTAYNVDAMTKKGIAPFDPGAENYLMYAIKIRNGQSRIFSLRRAAGLPVATMEYCQDTKAIRQIQGNPREIKKTSPFFRDLCEAIYQLSKEVDISGGIRDLPQERGFFGALLGLNFLMRNGERQGYYCGMDLDSVLSGSMCLNQHMLPVEVKALAECPNIVLDITDCSSAWLNENLPKEIKAKLVSNSSTPLQLDKVEKIGTLEMPHIKYLAMPKLKSAGNIHAYRAEGIAAPLLEEAGSLILPAVSQLSLPELKCVDLVNARFARNLSLPGLKKARDLIFNGAERVAIPALEKAGSIHARAADEVIFPLLKEVGDITLSSATTINMKVLEKAKNIVVGAAETLNLPKLRFAEDITAPSISNVVLPRLKRSNDIDIQAAQSAVFPALEDAGSLLFTCAQVVSLPQLNKSRNIAVGAVQTLDLPELTSCRDLSAANTQNVDAPKLKEATDIFLGVAAHVDLPALEKATAVRAIRARSLYMPELMTLDRLIADEVSALVLPKLQSVRLVTAANADTVEFPVAHYVGNLNAPHRSSLVLRHEVQQRMVDHNAEGRPGRLIGFPPPNNLPRPR